MSVPVEITYRLRGANTVAQAQRDLQEQIKQTERRFKDLSENSKRSQDQIAAAAVAMREKVAASRKEIERLQSTVGNTAIGKYAQNIEARRTLGIRAEVDIQKEIKNTEAAYQRLVSSGVLSAQQQSRAFDAMRQKVSALNAEMGKLTTAQKAMQAAPLIAGGAAALYSLKGPAEKAMSYDRRLAHLANTAYAERDAAGRISGMKTLEDSVNKAWRFGGGTREQAADALDTMIASGAVNDRDAMTMLPGIMKASTASNTDAKELATIAIRAKQNFKIKSEELPAILAGAMAAGQAGGFELKDMAKWLPQQMAMAGNLGISGKEGFARLAAWNQASVITSGTKDEAGNNLRDLLMEVNTPHFRKFMGEQYLGSGGPMKKGEKEKRMKDIDAIFLEYGSRGIDKVSATVDMAEKVFAKDKRYQELQAKLRATGKADKSGQREIIESMAAQVQGTAVGKIFHNQQSLMAFLGLLNNQQYSGDVMNQVRKQFDAPEDKSAISIAHEVISGTASYKTEQAGQEAATAQKNAMDVLTPAIGLAAEGFGAMAQKFPLMTAAVVGTVPPLIALSGVAGMTALTMGGRLPGGAAISRAAGLLSGTGMLATASRFAGGIGFAGTVGYGVGSALNWGIDKGIQAATGDKNQSLGGWLFDYFNSDKLKPLEAPKMTGEINVSVSDDRVSVKSTKLQSTGMTATMNTGNIHAGAPG